MKRDIPLTEIISELQKLPESTKIVVDTKSEVTFTGMIVSRKDGSKQIVEFVIPKNWVKLNK